MLTEEQVRKYVDLINTSDSIADAHTDIRDDLGRALTEEELAQIVSYNDNTVFNYRTDTTNPIGVCSSNCAATEYYDDKMSVDKVYRIRQLAEKLAETYARKNADYGDSFGISVHKYGIIAALTRMSDKWNRLENLILNMDKERHVSDESVLDTLLDMATYALMTYMEIENM